MLLSLREVAVTLGTFIAVTWLIGVSINQKETNRKGARNDGLSERVNTSDIFDSIAEHHFSESKHSAHSSALDTTGQRPPIHAKCDFKVSITRSDHNSDEVWKNISVANQRPSETFQFVRCSTERVEGRRCVKDLQIASGVNVLVNSVGEEVGDGSCCNLRNGIINSTRIRCTEGEKYQSFVNSTAQVTHEHMGKDTVVDDKVPNTSLSIEYSHRPVGGENRNTTTNPNTSDAVKLKIFVLTFDRSASLKRLLQSLSEAYYDKDGRTEESIELNIMIDVGKGARQVHNAAVVEVAEQFEWRHGKKTVHRQPVHVGLSGQWINSWRPYSTGPLRNEVGVGVYDASLHASDHTLAAVFEDDLVVSKFWWRWARAAHDAYGHRGDVAGYTLQRATQNADGGRNLAGGPADIFFYRLIGTWGVVFHPRAFSKFRSWFHLEAVGMDPRIHNARTLNGWYDSFVKAGTEKERFWSIWMDKFVDLHDYYFVYAKCSNGKTLASNMQESGLNFGGHGGRADFQRLTSDYPDLYKFPHSPVRLSWTGAPIGN
eukprot:m.133114 g.133114  ORF g.133114 m.133114 type:complete len:543 (-) comp17526_c1_seq1:482-2110(-)